MTVIFQKVCPPACPRACAPACAPCRPRKERPESAQPVCEALVPVKPGPSHLESETLALASDEEVGRTAVFFESGMDLLPLRSRQIASQMLAFVPCEPKPFCGASGLSLSYILNRRLPLGPGANRSAVALGLPRLRLQQGRLRSRLMPELTRCATSSWLSQSSHGLGPGSHRCYQQCSAYCWLQNHLSRDWR
jgi:hypothetical protein